MDYAIGLTAETLTDLKNIVPGSSGEAIPYPFPALYLPYTRIVGQNGQGAPVTMGPPTLEWNWDWLLLEWWNYFYTTIGGGNASVSVYVRTLVPGGDEPTFQTFTATMWQPTGEPIVGARRGNVKIRFTNLTAV